MRVMRPKMKIAIESSPGVIWRQRRGPEAQQFVRFRAPKV
jgi:hypothetical protein